METYNAVRCAMADNMDRNTTATNLTDFASVVVFFDGT